MAGRIRTLKPELLENPRTARLSHEAWRLFLSAIMLADDYGNLSADPDRLTGAVFWGRTAKTSMRELLSELVRVELIDLYRNRGSLYAHIIGWNEHQRVDKPGKPRVPGLEKADDPQGDVNAMFSDYSRDSRETPAKVRETPAKVRETPAPDLRPPTSDQDPDHDLNSCASASPREFDFGAVYAAYPKKVGRKKAKERFARDVTTQEKYDALVKAVGNYAAMIQANGTEYKFIKQFDSFMSIWEDWIDYVPPPEKQRTFKNVAIPRDHVTGPGGVVEDF